ncbi:sensor histidine kinase [Paractinoplanes rishiriensis]|uniref:histidine kinase n=1 Tax=Paractinoplanes rishiriensis TaxID=1050105 RepID=A0A919JVG7_9ACTN|nr:histidine kinase [Actinoplanes rishiriensis]GIE95593.1 hypothetical protein Ari01nite_30580 [Actinoplanes rishiriensis]
MTPIHPFAVARRPWLWRLLLLDAPLIAVVYSFDELLGSVADSHPEAMFAVQVATAVACGALFLRWRWPVPVFLLQFSLLLIVGILGAEFIGLALLLALHAVARQCDRRVSLAAAMACAVPFGTEHFVQHRTYGVSVELVVAQAGLIVLAWMLGYWMRRAAQEQLAARTAEQARRTELRRVAAELHDIITQSVALMRREATSARAALAGDRDRAQRALDAVQAAGNQAMAELRRMLTVMRLAADDEAPDRPHRTGFRPLAELALVAVALYFDRFVWIGDLGPADRWAMTWINAGALAGLLLRWRWPVAVFVAQLVYAGTVSLFVGGSDYVLGLLIALHAVARRASPETSQLAACGCAGPFFLQLLHQDNLDGPLSAAAGLSVYGVPTFLAWYLGFSMRRAAEGRAAARETERERREERLRLARDLHDVVSHTVTLMLLQAAGARAVLLQDPGRAAAALDAVHEAGERSADELGRLQALIEPADGADVRLPGLESLGELVRTMRATGLTVAVETTGEPRPLDPSVSLTAYRVIREALTNSTKYAGPDATAEVRLDWTGTELRIAVTDRRTGSRPSMPSTGHGLIGLRERVGIGGGTFTAAPSTEGFAVTAMLPLTATIDFAPHATRIRGRR